ncbi:hypothetical protein E3P77_01993 [Wallemia ichthyophaga]|nr:hypothetical protein E3P77_01993 [Wallemia ichthyophaga]
MPARKKPSRNNLKSGRSPRISPSPKPVINELDIHLEANDDAKKTAQQSSDRGFFDIWYHKDRSAMIILVILYLLQGVPTGLAFGSIPFLLKAKLSYSQIGFFSLSTYPYSLKLFWSPIVDACFNPKLGRRKSWIVPIQFLVGAMMYWMSFWIQDSLAQEVPDVNLLTFTFFMLIFLAATQDIAVDGWALTLLSNENLSFASTAQTIGLNTGYFLSFTVFLALNSIEFSNKYFRSTPLEVPLVTLGGYLQFFGAVFVLFTVWLTFFKKEENVITDEDEMDIKKVYSQMLSILKLKHVQSFVMIHLVAKIGFQANEAVTSLKLLEKGLSKEDLALAVLIDFPVQIIGGWLAAQWSQGRNPLKPWLSAFIGRLVYAVVAMLAIKFIEPPVTATIFTSVIAMTLVGGFMSTVQFVGICAFHTQIADPLIGGTYMTLLNTVSNLGGTWPRYFVLKAVDGLSIATCHVHEENEDVIVKAEDCSSEHAKSVCSDIGGKCVVERDGYFVTSTICVVLGAVILAAYIYPTARKLQRELKDTPMASTNIHSRHNFKPQVSLSSSRIAEMVDDARNTAFQALKPACVRLNFLVTKPNLTPNEPGLLSALEELSDSLSLNLSTTNSSLQLIRYVFFPIAGLLRHISPTELPEKGSVAVINALNSISKVWALEGVPTAEWEQLWMLSAMTLINSIKGGKSEVQLLSCVELIHTLSLNPSLDHASLLTTKRMSILGSLIAQLLDLATLHTFITLRTRSLQLVGVYVGEYAFDKPDINAVLLPGTASSITKILKGENHINSELAVAALETLRLIVMSTLNDDLCAALQPVQIADLTELANRIDLESLEVRGKVDERHRRDEGSIPVASSLFAPPSTTKKEEGIRTPSWLQGTVHQICLVLISTSKVVKHQSSRVRRAVAKLSADLLESCIGTLDNCHRLLLSNLLMLSVDSQASSEVSLIAKEALSRLLSLEPHRKILESLLKQHARDALIAIPSAIRSRDSSGIQATTAQIEAVAALTMRTSLSGIPMDDILGARGGVEKWAWGLIDCIPFATPPISGESVSVNASRSILWSSTPDAAFEIGVDGSDDPWFGFPAMPFESVDSKDGECIRRALVALGCAFGDRASHSVEYFFSLAQRNLHSRAAASALWLCCCILQGIARARSSVAMAHKLAVKLGRSVVKFSLEAEQLDRMEGDHEVSEEVVPHSDTNLPSEHVRGLDKVETLADNFKYTPQSNAKLEKRVRVTLITLITLRMIATTSYVLGYGGRPQLNHTLYYILSRLDSPTLTVMEHSRSTLASVSYYFGYASTSGAILDNADYLLNSVTSYLNPVRLDVAAPRVLIAAMRLVGAALISKLQGVVEDIFESLDDYHDIPLLGEGLLAVLDTIVSVMSDDAAILPSTDDEVVGEREREVAVADSRPDSAAELEGLSDWLRDLHADPPEEGVEDFGPTPHQAWDELREPHNVDQEQTPEDTPKEPLNRSQSICLKIMSKALHFLTHQSSFLRARTVMLMGNAVRVLMRSGHHSDVLPVVHRTWPYILHRLLSEKAAKKGEEYEESPHVIATAFELINVLAVETGAFMSMRIVEEAYPLIRRTIGFEGLRRGLSGDVNGNGRDINTVSNAKSTDNGIEYYQNTTPAKRAHKALVDAMRSVVQEIAVADELVWQLSADFTALLHHPLLKDDIVSLYEALSVRNVDIVWLCMKDVGNSAVALRGSRQRYAPHFDRLASEFNTAFISVDYRLAPQTGFHEILADVGQSVAFIIEQLPSRVGHTIDVSRWGVCGSSAGGWLSLLVGLGVANGKHVPKVCTAIYPITNTLAPFWTTPQGKAAWENEPVPFDSVKKYLNGDAPAVAENAAESSRSRSGCYVLQIPPPLLTGLSVRVDGAIRHSQRAALRKLEDIPPIYITHGTVDTAVPFAQAVEVVEALQKKGANVAFDIVPDKDHGWDEKEEGETMDRLYAFVGEHL